MTTECKKRFAHLENPIYAFVFISVLFHAALLWQVSTKVSFMSERLLGKTGGPSDAQEVSFFPSFGKSSETQVKRLSSAVDLPTTEQKMGSESQSGTDSSAKRGIGSGGTTTQYQATLHAYLDSVKVFPRHLKDLGLSGVVRVRFDVSPKGYLENIRLGEDSEAPLALQNEALRFLKKLDRVPVPPQDFSQQELHFELPLRYELKS